MPETKSAKVVREPIPTKSATKLQSTKSKAQTKAGPKSQRVKQAAKALRPKKTKSGSQAPNRDRVIKRNPLAARSKKYKASYKLIDNAKRYELKEAVALLPKLSTSKFIGSVEAHINLNIDPKKSEQSVRGTVTFPYGTGKSQRIAVLSSKNITAIKQAGADIVGLEEILEDIEKDKFNFDILIAIPETMPKLAKYAKKLGPKGLMPNPKSGTVTQKPQLAVKELRGGKTEFRVDSAGIIHQVIGKLDLTAAQIIENLLALIKAAQQAKPSGIKGSYIKSIALAPTMGPALKLDLKDVLK